MSSIALLLDRWPWLHRRQSRWHAAPGSTVSETPTATRSDTTRTIAATLAIGALCLPSARGEETVNWTDSSATKSWFNRGARIGWRNELGDWRDRFNVVQGADPYATTLIDDLDSTRRVEIDATLLVSDWVLGRYPNQGLMLRSQQRTGAVDFYSREVPEIAHHPRLRLIFPDGSEQTLPVVADTWLTGSSERALGTRGKFKVADGANAILRFDLDSLSAGFLPQRALLELHTTDRQFGADTVGLYRVAAFDYSRPVINPGLAANYPGDIDLETHPQVLFRADFEGWRWQRHWRLGGASGELLQTVSVGEKLKFQPLVGKALQIRIVAGQHLGTNLSLMFADALGEEPEEIYFRYYLRLANDWNQTRDGGKLPGLAGTYNRAGWGGRRPTGVDGWSLRGSFYPTVRTPNPLQGRTPIGYYAYHMDQATRYGSSWPWTQSALGVLANNRWYCLEQYVKLNQPAAADGVVRAWLDGVLAFEKSDVRFRSVEALKIERLWMNVYHGGTAVAPHTQHLFVDNVVLARGYIGPSPML